MAAQYPSYCYCVKVAKLGQLCAHVHPISASGYGWHLDGEQISQQPPDGMTLAGAMAAAIDQLNEVLRRYGEPKVAAHPDNWRQEPKPANLGAKKSGRADAGRIIRNE